MEDILQIIMAIVTAIGFSLIFNIHGKKIIATAAGGALTWITYLWIYSYSEDVFISCLFATMVSMAFAELMARCFKTPVIILLVPMLIPMVPGGDLYRMMINLVMANSNQTSYYGHQLVLEVGAIAFGIILISTALQLFHKLAVSHSKS